MMPTHGDAPGQAGRPLLAIVTGHLPPYREHFHRRIVAEMPEIRLATLVTKFKSGPWRNPEVREIGTVMFEPREQPAGSAAARYFHERSKGAALRRWLDEHVPAAVLLIGYDEIPNRHALRWANQRRVPVFLWADSNDRGDFATGLRRVAKNIIVPRICRKVDRVLVCGRAGEAYFRRYGVPEMKMARVPYEPDYALIEDMSAEQAATIAAEVGVPRDDARRRLVCCCRLVHEKRVDLLIDAFARVQSRFPSWDLLIVGDGPLRADLERRASESTPANRVRFLGFQDQRHVTAVYRRSHALALPSDYEPWALVINEAAAAGMAIVASDRVGAALELVEEGVNGHLIPAGDLEALVRALEQTMDPANIDRLRSASPGVLARWRREADPINGLRETLRATGVIPAGR